MVPQAIFVLRIATTRVAILFTALAKTKGQTLTHIQVHRLTLDNKTYFVFKCNVAAKEIYSEITAQIHNINATGDESLGNLYTYSVSEYANYLLDHLEVAEYAQAEYLVRAMLTYGDHAEYYFDKTADKPKDIEDVTIPDEFPETIHDTLPAYAEMAFARLWKKF